MTSFPFSHFQPGVHQKMFAILAIPGSKGLWDNPKHSCWEMWPSVRPWESEEFLHLEKVSKPQDPPLESVHLCLQPLYIFFFFPLFFRGPFTLSLLSEGGMQPLLAVSMKALLICRGDLSGQEAMSPPPPVLRRQDRPTISTLLPPLCKRSWPVPPFGNFSPWERLSLGSPRPSLLSLPLQGQDSLIIHGGHIP